MPVIKERERLVAYVVVAMAGLLVGMLLGQMQAQLHPRHEDAKPSHPTLPQPRTLGP